MGSSYPKLPDARWWKLRNHFKRTLPTKVTGGLLATILGIEISSANGALVALRDLGLVGEGDAPTDLANQWRHDDSYGNACAAMLEATYPAELREALPPPAPDRAGVQAWFARNLKTGQENARQMAALYILIASGQIRQDPPPSSAKTTATKSISKAPRGQDKGEPGTRQAVAPGSNEPRVEVLAPRLQVAVQVNLHPDMTPDQIDQVFRSMATNLYGVNTR